MCNVLLSVLALFFTNNDLICDDFSVVRGLPKANVTVPDRDVILANIFGEETSTVTQPLALSRWLSDSNDEEEPVFRGQGPSGTYADPLTPPGSPPLGGTYFPQDPFQIQGGPDPVIPYLNQPGPMVLSGINGPQPHRLGFTPIFDSAYILPSATKSPADGRFSVQEYDTQLRHVSLLATDWVFTNTAQAGMRVWSGPAKPNLPPQVYRLGWDFLLNSPQYGRWSAQFDFNPSLNTDFMGSIDRTAINLDANIAALYRLSPQWLFVLGVQYWDRVDNILIPNAGVVWNPNDRLEARILFPKSRISYFLGNFGTASHWAYVTGEYHVESYQIHNTGTTSNDQIQLADYRFTVGLRSDHSWYDKYVELGYVFARQDKFKNSTPDFDINGGIIARLGLRW